MNKFLKKRQIYNSPNYFTKKEITILFFSIIDREVNNKNFDRRVKNYAKQRRLRGKTESFESITRDFLRAKSATVKTGEKPRKRGTGRGGGGGGGGVALARFET